ncbi:acyltransferase, partial [Cribrihabitans sp. XS_ASV171]
FMIPVPFPHDPEAQKKMLDMRSKAMAHLGEGGVVALFPSGVVMSSDSWFGPALERDWNVFTAKMIRRSGARVVPIYFPGRNSRAYQIANRVSPVLRQGLLLHEIVRSCNKPQAPVIGEPVSDRDMELLERDPRGFMTWLRKHTLSLSEI